MSGKQGSVRFVWAIVMSGSAIVSLIQPGAAQEKTAPVLTVKERDPLEFRGANRAATTVKQWLAQMEVAQVQVTGVRLDRTETGLDIVLETAEGKPLTIDATKFRREGNSLIAEIPNATLALPQGQTFVADNPTADIATVQVVQQAGNIRVSVAGNNALPKTEVTLKTGGLAYSLNPEGDEADDEIVVTGAGRGAYRVPNASTATRTDTPIRDIPASIQVVPRQVLEDRGVQRETEALETISGVVESGDNIATFPGAGDISIRGFSTNRGGNFRDGLRSDAYINFTPIGVIEQVEVLKGPASVLFGALEPGGVINYVTRKPLAEPYYKIGFEAGNYGFYQPSIDLSGPLTKDRSVLYRLIAAYQRGGEFKDFASAEEYIASITPSISFKLGDRTNLSLFYEYGRSVANSTLEPLLGDGSLIPRNITGYYLGTSEIENQRFGYTLNHKFNNNWQLRHAFSTAFSSLNDTRVEYTSLLDNRFLTDYFGFDFVQSIDKYLGLIDVVGTFKTGKVSHQVVVGFDFSREVGYFGFAGDFVDVPPLDISNPNYHVPLPEIPHAQFTNFETYQSYGFYFQDQITFSDNLKMLIGGRYDWLSSATGPVDDDRNSQNDGAFSPRIGLVYQPSKTVSLYASYSQSFRPSIGRNPDNRPFEPTRGTQYEVGVKADFLDGKLSTTLAAYTLTKTNVLAPDSDPDLAREGFQVQVGEQRSRGIELDITGEILPGWNIVVAYALTDAEVTKDNAIPTTVGNRLRNVPLHQASLWTKYTIQKGTLKGLGFGLGLFYVGERQGDLDNSFQVGDYLRTDAAIYYRRGKFNAAINVRNLFNIDYVSSVNFGSLYINRGNPLTIIGSISWEF